MTKVTYLGHVFSKAGMAPDPQKIQAITSWTVPQDVHQVRQFLGLASYYRRYIHHFADIAQPLYNLTQKNVPFEWNSACQTAFDILKRKLTSAPVLSYPCFDDCASSFVLQTDASDMVLRLFWNKMVMSLLTPADQ